MIERPKPTLTGADNLELRVLQVGVCGTDREEIAGGRALPQDGREDLVIGHEMIGQVVSVSSSVARVRPGDYAVLTVRRGCGKCRNCAMNRPDMCATGRYRERGIWGLDGYQTDCVVDAEAFVVRIPDDLASIGVLTEPLSVAEKAIDEAVRVQMARLPGALAVPDWLCGRRCLVAGLGPIGLLAAMVLRLRDATVFGLDVVDASSARPRWLEGIGGVYVDGRRVGAKELGGEIGAFDLIVDATGVVSLEFDLLDALTFNGVYVLTGLPGGQRPIDVQGARLIRHLVLGNQIIVGSVNASRDHFQRAVDDLGRARQRWRDHVARMITHRYPCNEFARALSDHGPDAIKVVIEWHKAAPRGE
jgi:threonine dehydrogenase-like Zn-dependent dehydrogenase